MGNLRRVPHLRAGATTFIPRAIQGLLAAAPLFAAQLPGERSAAGGWGEFPAFVWRLDGAGRPLDAGLARDFGGTNAGRREALGWAEDAGLDVYVDHAAGREPLHRDRGGSGAAACLFSARVQDQLRGELEATLAAHAGGEPLGYSLGDEVALTPGGWPEEACRCAECERALGGRLGPTTDATLAALARGDGTLLPAWLDRREADLARLGALARELRGSLAERRPSAAAGWMGLSGASPLADLTLEAALDCGDFLEVYPLAGARELAFSARGVGQRILSTVFVGQESAAGAAWLVAEHWLRGGDGLVLWSDRELAADSARQAALAAAVADARARGAHAAAPAGVALVHSQADLLRDWCECAAMSGDDWRSWTPGRYESDGRLPARRRAWLRLLEDAGGLPGALASDELPRAPGRWRCLVLVRPSCADEALVAALELWLRSGGRLVVDGPLCADPRWPAAPSPAELRRRLERAGDVASAPGELDDYCARRLGSAGERRAAALLRDFARSEYWGDDAAPWVLAGEAASWPWLQARAPAADGGTLLALLPNLATADERRRHARPLELELLPESGAGARWIWPPASARTVLLAAGEPALLELP
jgi:hypothetical protein